MQFGPGAKAWCLGAVVAFGGMAGPWPLIADPVWAAQIDARQEVAAALFAASATQAAEKRVTDAQLSALRAQIVKLQAVLDKLARNVRPICRHQALVRCRAHALHEKVHEIRGQVRFFVVETEKCPIAIVVDRAHNLPGVLFGRRTMRVV